MRVGFLFSMILFGAGLTGDSRADVRELYKTYCLSCHGENMEGESAPSMVDDEWTYGFSDEVMADVIREGRPNDGMPGFGEAFSDEQIRSLVILIKEKHARASPEPLPEKMDTGVRQIEDHAFRLETVADDLDLPWAVEIFPNGDLLVSERDGRLLRIDPDTDGREVIRGIPEVYARGQGGLLDVALDPGYEENGWVYLSFSDPVGGESMTSIVRGRIQGDEWVDEQIVFEAPEEFYLSGGAHFGTRLVFEGDYLYFAIGDRRRRGHSQDLSRPNGKIHRIHPDGSIPKDNPFVDDPEAFPTIWSYGHRNPQGMALDPGTGRLWSTEHGPRGGDELNLVERGENYGWPVVTFGMNYNGTPITDRTSAPGMKDPVVHWTPSLAVCGLAFYEGDAFPGWTGSLLSGGLAGQDLRLIRLDGEEVAEQQILIKGEGRIRDVIVGPDGLPYVVFNGGGRIVRMVPAE